MLTNFKKSVVKYNGLTFGGHNDTHTKFINIKTKKMLNHTSINVWQNCQVISGNTSYKVQTTVSTQVTEIPCMCFAQLLVTMNRNCKEMKLSLITIKADMWSPCCCGNERVTWVTEEIHDDMRK